MSANCKVKCDGVSFASMSQNILKPTLVEDRLDVLALMHDANDLNGVRGDLIEDRVRLYKYRTQPGDEFVAGPSKLRIIEEPFAGTPQYPLMLVGYIRRPLVCAVNPN